MKKGNGSGGQALTAVWAVLAVIALWTAAASIEITIPLWGSVFATMGDVYPLPTTRVLEMARLHIAWWVAGLASLVIVILWFLRSSFLTIACILALFLSAISAALTALSMSLPLYKYVPVIY